MQFRKWIYFVMTAALVLSIYGCACSSNVCKEAEHTGDLHVGLIVSQPLVFYYGTTGLIEVWGPEDLYLSQQIPMYLGNQVAIFRNLPVGRYIVTLSYSGFVITKGAVLCGDGGDAWKADCVGSLKDAIKRGKPQGQYTDVMGSQYGYYGWTQTTENVQQYNPYGYGSDNNQNAGGWTTPEPQQKDMVAADPMIGHTEPCQTVIIFNMPEDVFKYNSAEKGN